MKTREDYINAIIGIAQDFTKPGGYTYEKDLEMNNICSEWNNSHWGSDEIFIMDDAEGSDGRCGFAVEDDFFPVADWND